MSERHSNLFSFFSTPPETLCCQATWTKGTSWHSCYRLFPPFRLWPFLSVMYTFASVFWPQQSWSLKFFQTHFCDLPPIPSVCWPKGWPAVYLSRNLPLTFLFSYKELFHLSRTNGCNYIWKLHRFFEKTKSSLFPGRHEKYLPCSHLWKELLEFLIGSWSIQFERTNRDSFYQIGIWAVYCCCINHKSVVEKKQHEWNYIGFSNDLFCFHKHENAAQVQNYRSIKTAVSSAAANKRLLSRTVAACRGSRLVSEQMEKKTSWKRSRLGKMGKWVEVQGVLKWRQRFPSDKVSAK